MFADDWFSIHAKQVDKVGQREAAAFCKRRPPERIIKLLTVQEILDEEHVQKM